MHIFLCNGRFSWINLIHLNARDLWFTLFFGNRTFNTVVPLDAPGRMIVVFRDSNTGELSFTSSMLINRRRMDSLKSSVDPGLSLRRYYPYIYLGLYRKSHNCFSVVKTSFLMHHTLFPPKSYLSLLNAVKNRQNFIVFTRETFLPGCDD